MLKNGCRFEPRTTDCCFSSFFFLELFVSSLKKNLCVPPGTYVALIKCSGIIVKIPE